MKKYSVFCVTILVIALLFSSCGIKNSKKDKNTEAGASNSQLGSADLPTVTDKNGDKIDYSVNITDPTDGADVQTPYLSVGSLKDINSKAGTNIKQPAGLKATNEEFDLDDTVSPKIASYSFMVNDKDYTILASRKTGALLFNIRLSDGTVLGEELEDTQELLPARYENFCVARWFDDGVQYNIYAENVTLSEFKTVYSKVK